VPLFWRRETERFCILVSAKNIAACGDYRGQNRHRAVIALENQKATVSAANLRKLIARIRARALIYYLFGDSDVAEFVA
jgi:hypothetical protein